MIRTAADLMQRELVTVEASATLRELAGVLQEHGIHGVPVLGPAGMPIGVVSRTDLVAAVTSGEIDRPATHHWYAIDDDDVVFTDDDERVEPASIDAERTVREIMSPDLVTVRSTATAGALARKMARHRVQRLLVTEGGKLVGIVSVSDLLRCLSEYETTIDLAHPAKPVAKARAAQDD